MGQERHRSVGSLPVSKKVPFLDDGKIANNLHIRVYVIPRTSCIGYTKSVCWRFYRRSEIWIASFFRPCFNQMAIDFPKQVGKATAFSFKAVKSMYIHPCTKWQWRWLLFKRSARPFLSLFWICRCRNINSKDICLVANSVIRWGEIWEVRPRGFRGFGEIWGVDIGQDVQFATEWLWLVI